MTKLRLAIVGAGPAGIYAADILLKAERKFDVSIDLFEQLRDRVGAHANLQAQARKLCLTEPEQQRQPLRG